MNKISTQELCKYINEIIECDAFELHSDVSSDKHTPAVYYIPYMMNDALECYFLLKNCKMTGTYLPDSKEKITIEAISNDSTPTNASSFAIIFHQGNNNVFTLWFEEAFCVLNCFRYDQIGHFWVKGAEHWRRLVYILGTIYDKYEYMGKHDALPLTSLNHICNQKEMELLPLMEFAPFRMHSPIHESLDAYYTDSDAGLECMCSLAKEAGDFKFLKLLFLYKKIPFPFMKKWLFHAIRHPNRQALYELLFSKIQEASMEYPERSYSDALNKKIQAERTQVTQRLHQAGFSGNYPLFTKDDVRILAMEEQPFTILEATDFTFRIQFMISKTSKPNHCWIASEIDSIFL